MTTRIRVAATLATASVALTLVGCAPGDDPAGPANTSTQVCVILPDATSSTRWEEQERPALDEALRSVGFRVEIGNAMGQPRNYADLAKRQLDSGCRAMVLVDFQGAATTVVDDAHAVGATVVAYGRPLAGADRFVSFDEVEVGRLQAESILDGLAAAGVSPASASVVAIPGDPSDGTTAMQAEGSAEVLGDAGVTLASELSGGWDILAAAAGMRGAISELGTVDAVLAGNDTNAAGAVIALGEAGLSVPVSGQDATLDGLRNILLGTQTSTVYKPASTSAQLLTTVLLGVMSGEEIEGDAELADGTPHHIVAPVLITLDDVKLVVDAGDVSVEALCAGATADACASLGID